jgi:hypothetical protein
MSRLAAFILKRKRNNFNTRFKRKNISSSTSFDNHGKGKRLYKCSLSLYDQPFQITRHPRTNQFDGF